MSLFDRRVVLTVGTRRIEGDRIEAGVRVHGLRIQFKVTQSLAAESNTADATVYNLNEASQGALSLALKPQFIIEAGYIDTAGALFSGVAERITHQRMLPGFSTSISATDGATEGRRIINGVLAPRATVAQVLELIATAMQVNATRAIAQAKSGKFDRQIASFFNGYTICGTGKVELDKLTRALGVRWTIVNGELLLLGPDDATQEEAIVLSEDSGLIRAPTRHYDSKRPRKLLYSVISLLQPKLKPGRRVQLDSRSARGAFRVEQSEHGGDTHGAEWYSTAIIAEVKS
jgi:hypothetical protein